VKELLEAAMLICFGVSWPISARKLIRSRTIKGVSEVFLWLVFVGYILGSIGKAAYDPTYVLAVYLFNSTMVGVNIIIYYRNKRLEQAASGE
jgi:lipopolysaccharide export LptBFGC system permease protein LptF